MKFHILRNLESHLVKERVPTEYKSLALSCESQLGESCTLITFPHDRKDVVKSSLVEKALKKLGDLSDSSLVVVGGCFSVEAVEILNLKNAVFLSLSEYQWTDSRYNETHSGRPKH
jgi:hypothetical protein